MFGVWGKHLQLFSNLFKRQIPRERDFDCTRDGSVTYLIFDKLDFIVFSVETLINIEFKEKER
jgi:hypothetical protein